MLSGILNEAFLIIGVIYLLGINVVEFTLMYIDKERAKAKQYRISERTLFIVAILGGSIGAILGMQVFRHKTKHISFTFGMPAILVVQIILLLLCKFFFV